MQINSISTIQETQSSEKLPFRDALVMNFSNVKQDTFVKTAQTVQFTGISTDPDHQRYMDIVKGKVREDLSNFMLPADAEIENGNVSVPLQPIELPRFIRAKDEDETGQGEGEEGDEVGEVDENGEPQEGSGADGEGEGQPQEGPAGENGGKPQPGEGQPQPGEGQPGEGPGEPGEVPGEPGEEPGEGDQAGDGSQDLDLDEFGINFTRQEIFEMIDSDDLELPNFEERGGANIQKILYRFRTISKHGPDGLINLIKTMQNYLQRSLPLLADQLEEAGEITDLSNAPVSQDDLRMKAVKEVEIPRERAVIINLIDTSGSMNDERKLIARNTNYFFSTYVQGKYGELNANLRGDIATEDDLGDGVEEVFITHDTEAEEVSEEEFYLRKKGGGTKFGPPMELVEEIIEERYPLDQWNVYINHYTDGDNYGNSGAGPGGSDNDVAIGVIRRLLEKGLNAYNYVQVDKSPVGNQANNKFKPVLDKAFGRNHTHVRTEEITQVKDSEFKRVVHSLLEARDEFDIEQP